MSECDIAINHMDVLWACLNMAREQLCDCSSASPLQKWSKLLTTGL